VNARVSSPLLLSVVGGDGTTIATSFQFVAGRFRHSISLNHPDGGIVDRWDDEAQSDNDDWPASPPIQQLSLESIHGAPTLLGVGQAGKSHWSISVESSTLDSKPALKFDLACRCRAQPFWLGSTYERSHIMGDKAPILRMINVASLKPIVSETLAISCVCDPAAITKYPGTFRWSYLIAAG